MAKQKTKENVLRESDFIFLFQQKTNNGFKWQQTGKKEIIGTSGKIRSYYLSVLLGFTYVLVFLIDLKDTLLFGNLYLFCICSCLVVVSL